MEPSSQAGLAQTASASTDAQHVERNAGTEGAYVEGFEVTDIVEDGFRNRQRLEWRQELVILLACQVSVLNCVRQPETTASRAKGHDHKSATIVVTAV